MATYIITYDLHDPANSPDVLAYVQTLGGMQVSQSSYVAVTTKTANQIVTDLRGITKDKITIYVFPVHDPHDGFGPKATNAWLQKIMPDA